MTTELAIDSAIQVLLIDDDPHLRQALSQTLQNRKRNEKNKQIKQTNNKTNQNKTRSTKPIQKQSIQTRINKRTNR